MVKIQVGLKSCSFHRRIQWWNSFCPTRLLLSRRAKNVSKISAQLWSPRGKLSLSSPRGRTSSPRAHRKTSSLVTSRTEKNKNVWKSDKSWEPGMLLKTWKLWKLENLEKLENLKTWKFENFENLKNDPWDMLNNFCFHVYAQKSLFIGENVNDFFLTTATATAASPSPVTFEFIELVPS